MYMAVFLNRRSAARFRAMALNIAREILLELITNLSVILYLLASHAVYIIALILLTVMS